MIRIPLLSVGILLGLTANLLPAQEKFMGKTVEGWTQQLKGSKDPNQRRNAAFILGKMGNKALHALPDLKQALKQEKEAVVRESIVFSLGDISREAGALNPDRDLEALFLAALKDGDAVVRRSAAYALGCLGSGSADTQKALDGALEDPSPGVRQNAAWALGKFVRVGGKSQESAVLASLQKALHDEDSFVKRDAASSLLQCEDAEKVHSLVKDLLPLCRDSNSEVRRAALNVLGRVVDSKDQAAIPALRWALDDRDLENKRNAALALSNIGGEETVIALPVLLEAAKNGDLELRRQAVMAVRNIGPKAESAVPELMRLLQLDKDEQVRRNAALALGGIGKAAEPAIPLLVLKLEDTREDRETRKECAMALSRIGPVPAAIKIVPNLLQVLGNPKNDPTVRERAIWALRIHGAELRNMENTKDGFSSVLKEPLSGHNKMLRYDCAYMLGMIWQQQAPDVTLDVLQEFLHDSTILLFEGTRSNVGTSSTEVISGNAKVEELGKGDGRIMAVDALKMIGPARYGQRPALMKQLRQLASENTTYPPLRKKAAELVRDGE